MQFDINFIYTCLNNNPRVKFSNGIPKNTQSLKTFQFNSFQFLDSLHFLNASLAELGDILEKSNHHYPFLSQSKLCLDENGCFSEERKALLTKKSSFPYEKVKEDLGYLNMRHFPEISDFFSSLTESITIDPQDYLNAKRVFDFFQLNSMREFLELYNGVDCIVLCEVCENYEKIMASKFGLYPFR